MVIPRTWYLIQQNNIYLVVWRFEPDYKIWYLNSDWESELLWHDLSLLPQITDPNIWYAATSWTHWSKSRVLEIKHSLSKIASVSLIPVNFPLILVRKNCWLCLSLNPEAPSRKGVDYFRIVSPGLYMKERAFLQPVSTKRHNLFTVSSMRQFTAVRNDFCDRTTWVDHPGVR